MENTTREKRKNTFVKKGALIALAVALVTPALAGCDELNFGGVASGSEEIYLESFEPEAYGLVGPFAGELNIEALLSEENVGYVYLDDIVNSLSNYSSLRDLRKGKGMNASKCIAYWSLARSDELRKNVVLPLKNVSKDKSTWEHSIVSTSDDFVLMSQDWKGTKYFTGFVNGEFRNDVGFISKETIDVVQKTIKERGYEETLGISRMSFFGMLAYYDCEEEDNKNFSVSSKSETRNPENNLMSAYGFIEDFELYDSNDNTIISIALEYDISEDYLDKYVWKESGQEQ